MNNLTFDKRLFSNLDFGETQVKDKQGNVVGEIDESGCWCLNNGMKIAPEKTQQPKTNKRKKIKLL